MFQKFLALIFTLLFAGALVTSRFTLPEVTWALLGLGALVAVFYFFLHRRDVHRFSSMTFVLPSLLWVSGFASVIFLLDNFWRYAALLVFAAVLVRLLSAARPNARPLVSDTLFFIIVAANFLGLWAGEFYFTPAWWKVLAAVFVLSFLLFWLAFYGTGANSSKQVLYSVIPAFLFTEAAWALLYWPLYFFSLTAIMCGFFFFIWQILRFKLLGQLTRKKVFFHAGFAVLAEILVLVFSTWLPKI